LVVICDSIRASTKLPVYCFNGSNYDHSDSSQQIQKAKPKQATRPDLPSCDISDNVHCRLNNSTRRRRINWINLNFTISNWRKLPLIRLLRRVVMRLLIKLLTRLLKRVLIRKQINWIPVHQLCITILEHGQSLR